MDWWIAYECIDEKYLCLCILENGHIFDAGTYEDPSVGVHLNDPNNYSALFEHYGELDFKGVVPWYSLSVELQDRIRSMAWLGSSKVVERLKKIHHLRDGAVDG
jgi:hypothetical protein